MLSIAGRQLGILFLLSVLAAGALAEVPPEQQEFRSLDEQVQGLKGEVISINRELMLLQEKLVYPSSTQISVFVSLEGGKDFSLDSIELKLDGRVAEKHLYSFRELEALRNKGVQRLHTANLGNGKHQIEVAIAGHAGSNQSYRKLAVFPIIKETGPRLVEIRVIGSGSSPSIKLDTWK